MIVGKYIRQLLDERKQVVLPGFGNLQVMESGGGVPTSGSSIDPPGIWVRFDSAFSKDDGLLASVYGEGEELDKEEAGQRVLELVDAIKFALDKGESYALPKTGSFMRDDDGKVHFKVDMDWVIEPDQYGLESMDLLELEDLPSSEQEAPEKPIDKANDEASESKEKPISAGVSTPPASPTLPKQEPKPITNLAEPQPQKKSTRHIKRWRAIWIIAGVLIVTLMALIFLPGDPNQQPEPKDTEVQGQVGTEKQNEAGSVTSDERSDTAATEQQNAAGLPEEGSETVTGLATEEVQPAGDSNKYFIIAGSFKHLKYASELQDQLKARGYNAEVMVTENRMYRVIVAAFVLKDEAERILASVKSEPGMESCWLLSK